MLRSVESANRQNQQKGGTPPAASSLVGRHAAPPESKVVRLQAMHGNQGVQRMLRGGILQRKLTINQPGDAFEQEADRVADKVMRMADPAVTREPVATSGMGAKLQRCSCGKSADTGTQCEECKSQAMQLQRSSAAFTGATTAPPIVHEVLNSSGRPLDAATRNFMEPHFGADFSKVRVHTDGKAAESARAVDALAYTAGSNIVFSSGQFAPTTTVGQRMLAHELTHVAQQGHAPATASLSENRGAASATTDTSVMKISNHLQRFSCDTGVAPGMSCSDAQGSGHPSGVNLEHFDQDQDTLKPAHTTAITAFISGWVARGSSETVEVHGYASCDGPANSNVQLSCNRAEKVKATLASGGVTTSINTFAHGETDEFGSGLDPNRRVIISTIVPPQPQPVCPQCPEDPRSPGCPPCPPPASRPVFLCVKSIPGSLIHRQSHAFFRVGGSGPGTSTFELEHDERGDHCACGVQGIPQRDYQEDVDSTDPCIPMPAVSESCLLQNWDTYPVGKYCALGPNSNTYVRFLLERCGATGVRPPGNVAGFDDSPPTAGTANDTMDARLFFICDEVNCNDESCNPPAPDPREQQVECVKDQGLCGIPGGIPTEDQVRSWNAQCRAQSHYEGPDITTEECQLP